MLSFLSFNISRYVLRDANKTAHPLIGTAFRQYKVKTNKSIARRFIKLSSRASGHPVGFKYRPSGKNHNLGSKSGDRLTRISSTTLLQKCHLRTMRRFNL